MLVFAYVCIMLETYKRIIEKYVIPNQLVINNILSTLENSWSIRQSNCKFAEITQANNFFNRHRDPQQKWYVFEYVL